MTPVGLHTISPFTGFQAVSSVRPVQEPEGAADEFFTEQLRVTSLDPLLLDQLPAGPAQDIANIFRNISTLSLQSVEVGQTIENRETLQALAQDELAVLQEVLDDLAQEDLTLFAAVFQHQLPDALLNSTGNNSDVFFDSNLDNASSNALEGFFQIDLRTESGTLAALDLASVVLDTLALFDTGSNFLDSFLEDLADFGVNPSQIDLSEFESEAEESADVEDDDDIAPVEQNEPLVPAGSNPLTIIELAG